MLVLLKMFCSKSISNEAVFQLINVIQYMRHVDTHLKKELTPWLLVMSSYSIMNLVNIGSGNGLPLELMLMYQFWCPMAATWGQFLLAVLKK